MHVEQGCEEVFWRRQLETFFVWLFFLYPLGMSSIRHYSSTFLFLMVLTAVPLLLLGKRKPTREQILIVCGMLFFVCSLLPSFMNAEDYYGGFKALGNLSYLLLLLPLFWGAVNCRFDLRRLFLWGLLLAAPVNVGIAFYSSIIQNLPRAKGYYNPIIFGDLALLSAMLLLCWVFVAGLQKFTFLQIFAWLAFFSFLLVGLMSGTRGAFLVLPPVVCVLWWFLRTQVNCKSLRIPLLMTLVVIALTFGAIFTNVQLGSVGVMQRYGIMSFADFLDPTSLVTAASNNARLQMWKHSLYIFLENPLTGTGLGDFHAEIIRKIQSGSIHLSKDYNHAHSIFFHYLAVSGLLGLSSMIFALIFLPIRQLLEVTRKNPHYHLNLLAILVVILCFAIFGLTENWLARSPMVSCFVVSMVAFFPANPTRKMYETNSTFCHSHHEK